MSQTAVHSESLASTPTQEQVWLRQGMLGVVLVAHVVTIIITWPVWNVRETPANMPLVPGLEVSFGWLMLLSLLPILWRPLSGAALHTVIFGLACVADQYRVQPQFVSLLVLLWAVVCDPGVWFARYYLAAMWLWAGLHKLFSPEWFGSSSWWFVSESGFPDGDFVLFAWVVAVAEIVLGVVAMIRPRWAAWPCLVMHVAIFVSLSPLGRNYNVSVWPWNLASGIVGAWVLWRVVSPPRVTLRYAAWATLFLAPAGFYLDWVNPHLAFVLYSGQMPRGVHIREDSLQRLEGWAGLNVPFPDSPRMFVAYFRRTAKPGEKLFVGDPRPGLPERYFLMRTDGAVEEVTRERFMRVDSPGEVPGVETADANDIWLTRRAGFQMPANEQGLFLSASLENTVLPPADWQRLRKLPNLRELKLSDVVLAAAACDALASLEPLELLELTRTTIDAEADLLDCVPPTVHWLALTDIALSPRDLESLAKLKRLQVLKLNALPLTDAQLGLLRPCAKLEWLELQQTRVTGAGITHLAELPQLSWLNLTDTPIDDAGCEALSSLPHLQILQLGGTNITDAGLAKLVNCRGLTKLNLERTSVSAQAVEEFQQALPECSVVR